jgi:hypothetical protein
LRELVKDTNIFIISERYEHLILDGLLTFPCFAIRICSKSLYVSPSGKYFIVPDETGILRGSGMADSRIPEIPSFSNCCFTPTQVALASFKKV